MKKYVFGTYRPSFYNKGEGEYLPSYRLDMQYKDYKEAGITATLDNEIPLDRYTTEIAPGIKKQTRFIIGEYEDTVVDPVLYKANIANVGAEFQIEIFPTVADTIIWIKANTNLVEDVAIPGKFLINKATTMMGNPVPAKYLIIQ